VPTFYTHKGFIIGPGTSTDYVMATAVFGTFRVFLRTVLIITGRIPIRHPFPDTAQHVMNAPCIRFLAPYRVWGPDRISGMPYIIIEFFSIRICPLASSAGGIFPFCLCREPFPLQGTVLLRILKSDMISRPIIVV
jgi:hypothetical protein